MEKNNAYSPWGSWRREQRALDMCKFHIERAYDTYAFLERRLHVSIARELATTRAGLKVLHAYTGNSMRAWRIACGTDGRIRKLAERIEWERFRKIISVARRMEATPKELWPSSWMR